MDLEKIDFLFGDVPAEADLTDPDERSALFAVHHPSDDRLQAAVREAVAAQILEDDPPEAWGATQRLLALGLTPTEVMSQLLVTFTPHVLSAIDDEGLEPESYAASLSRLPLPEVKAARQALLAATRARRAATMEELIADATAALGASVEDPAVEALLDQVLDSLLTQPSGLTMLAGDLVVHVPDLVAEVMLTHRLVDPTPDVLSEAGIDLGAFDWLDADPLHVAEPGLIVVGLSEGALTVTSLVDEPAVDPALVARIRRYYDRAVDEPWLPVEVDEIVIAAQIEDPTSFASPQAPLSRLLAEAGLELRGGEVAHDLSVWHNAENASVLWTLRESLDDDVLDDVVRAYDLTSQELDRSQARDLLDLLEDPEVVAAVADLLLGRTDDPVRLESTAMLAGRLAEAASRPAQHAVSGWLLTVVAERHGRLQDAERVLRDAVHAEPGWGPTADRLAWYLSDRGEAAAALSMWVALGATADDSDDVRELRSLPPAPAASLGRNDRCWCGSGRKFKQCHLGRPEPLPLPERVGWLCRKATAYLERRGGAPGDHVVDAVRARAVDDTEKSILAAFSDPLVLDTVLHEGGWFERFLDERGELLPADELLLGRAWTLVDRTVYDIEQVRPGDGVTVRDLASGERVEVRERTFSRAARVGARVCGRAVPDGHSHQFIGGLFDVQPGREEHLLDLLARGDGLELLEYVAALHRPPVLIGPDGSRFDLSGLPAGPAPAPEPVDPQVAAQVMAQLEQRWCTEPVPALAGLTPEQAAADPTRRDDLRRLIDSFPEPDFAAGLMTFRPQALRDRLGLTD